MHQKIKRIEFLALLMLFLFGCNYPTHSKSNKNQNIEFVKTKESCLNAFSEFADTLRVNDVRLLNDTNKGKNDIMKNCNLKDYRHEFKMQSAIVLIVLKFYNFNLKQGWPHEKAEVIANMSKLTNQIIFEYAYLYYGKDQYYSEDLNVDDIVGFIKKNPVFLKDPQIQKQYYDSFKINRKK